MRGVLRPPSRAPDAPSAGQQGASALSPSRRRGIAAPIVCLLITTVIVVMLTQATIVPAAISPHAAATTRMPDRTGLAALRTATTTTTTSTSVPPTTTTSTSPPPTTTEPAPPPPAPSAASLLPARGRATAWGCDAALAYLHAYAAPGFTLECPGYADGHQGMTCANQPGSCPNTAVIAIADPCPQTYMNEASNSWVLTGQSNAPIDPYGACP